MANRDAGADADLAGLEASLSAALGETVVDTEVLGDGLNLVVAVSTGERGRAYVVRRPNEFRESGLFVDLRTEYRILDRLRDTDVPAPAPVWFCENDSLLGGPFFVTTYLDGEAVPWYTGLPERFRTARARERIGTGLIDTLVDIHSLDADRFEDVCEHVTPLEQVDRATERLDAATEVTGYEVPTLWAVGEWLRENAPAATRGSGPGATLVHGDYRPGNVLLGGEARPEITGVLDWETATLGDPRTELGYVLLNWGERSDPTPPLAALERRYPDDRLATVREANEHGLNRFTTRPGSPTRRDVVARYEERTGITYEHDRFFRAHAAFMLATVWLDIHRHGVEAGDEADGVPMVEYVATVAERIAGGDYPL